MVLARLSQMIPNLLGQIPCLLDYGVLSMIMFIDFSWSNIIYIYSPNAKPPQFSSSILLRSSVFHISSHGFSMFSHGFPMVFPLGPSPSAKACGLDGAPPSHSEPQQLTRCATGVYGGSPEPGASWPVRRWLVKGSLW